MTIAAEVAPANADIYVGTYEQGVGRYDTTTGAAINPLLIDMGVESDPYALAIDGNTLFVGNDITGSVGTYDATTGAPLNAGFITGLDGVRGMALRGDTLYVVNFSTVGTYDAATGAAIHAELVTNLRGGAAVLVSGETLYVSQEGRGVVSTYDAITGALLEEEFIRGLQRPEGMALASGGLYVADLSGGTVGLYDAATGTSYDSEFLELGGPVPLQVLGNVLYVLSTDDGFVGTYDIATGEPIDADLVQAVEGNSYGMLVVDAATIVRFRAALNFRKPHKDGYVLTGTLALPAEFATRRRDVHVDVGGVRSKFTLDAHGRARTRAGTLRLKHSRLTGLWSFTVKVRKGDFAADWANDGFVEETGEKALTLPFGIRVVDTTYAGTKELSYTGRAGRTGKLE